MYRSALPTAGGGRVSTPSLLLLTSRRAVDLCRVGSCLCRFA